MHSVNSQYNIIIDTGRNKSCLNADLSEGQLFKKKTLQVMIVLNKPGIQGLFIDENILTDSSLAQLEEHHINLRFKLW